MGSELIRAIGDSIELRIKSGDPLLINTPYAPIHDHANYTLNYNDHVVVKRPGTAATGLLLLINDNPPWKSEDVSKADTESLRLIGRVVWSGTVV